MTRRFDLVIFDWDGTLMDSEAKIVRCFQGAAKDAGAPYPGDAAVSNIIGLGLEEAINEIFPKSDASMREAVLEAYRDHFLVHDNTAMPLFTGVAEGLADMANMGYQMAVATGKARRGLNRVLRDSPLKEFFTITRCADETRSKPHPLMLEEIILETGISRQRTIMVGDTVYDLEMAKNAGIDSLAVSYGVHPCDRLAEYTIYQCMHSFGDVRNWFCQ
ncbi:MAG: HAD-IA family hydrolase [Acidiferrobacterales bacterium]